jgi:hypothetical protein
LHQKNCLTIFHFANNTVRAYQSLGVPHHGFGVGYGGFYRGVGAFR